MIYDLLYEMNGLNMDDLNYVFEDLRAGDYDDIVKIFKDLSKKEKGYLSPNHPDRYIDSPYAIYRKIEYKDSKPIGFIELLKFKKLNNIPEISFAVSKDWRGKGISEKLFKSAVDYCKANGEKYILWVCDKDNIASNKFAEKHGFELHAVNDKENEYIYRYKIK